MGVTPLECFRKSTLSTRYQAIKIRALLARIKVARGTRLTSHSRRMFIFRPSVTRAFDYNPVFHFLLLRINSPP
jgi:hypothetical protein